MWHLCMTRHDVGPLHWSTPGGLPSHPPVYDPVRGKAIAPVIREDVNPRHMRRMGPFHLCTAEHVANTMHCLYLGPGILNFRLRCCTYLSNRQFPNWSQSTAHTLALLPNFPFIIVTAGKHPVSRCGSNPALVSSTPFISPKALKG